jgi:hypothetical protein
MTFICTLNYEKMGEVSASTEEKALVKAIHLYGMEVDIKLK